MLTNLVSMVGVDSFLTAENTAAVRSFNRFGKIAWAALFWRLRLDHERVGPWVVSELTMRIAGVRKFVDLQSNSTAQV